MPFGMVFSVKTHHCASEERADGLRPTCRPPGKAQIAVNRLIGGGAVEGPWTTDKSPRGDRHHQVVAVGGRCIIV